MLTTGRVPKPSSDVMADTRCLPNVLGIVLLSDVSHLTAMILTSHFEDSLAPDAHTSFPMEKAWGIWELGQCQAPC